MTAVELFRIVVAVNSFDLFPEAARETGVLVAHADADAQVQVGLDLARRGYRVWTAGTGADAVAEGLAHADTLAALVCDTGLPDLPAAEVYRRLKLRLPELRCCEVPPAPGRG